MLDDGLLVTTSNGGGEITDSGGTWRPIIKHYYIVQWCCKKHSNTLEGLRKKRRIKRNTKIYKNDTKIPYNEIQSTIYYLHSIIPGVEVPIQTELTH